MPSGIATPLSDGPVPPSASAAPASGSTSPSSFLDNLYGALFTPRRAFADLAADPPLGQAVILFVIIDVVGAATMSSRLLTGLGAGGRGILAPVGLIVSLLVFSFFLWFLSAAVLNLLAEFLGGRGRGATLFVLLAFAEAPALLTGPIRILRTTFLGPIAVLASIAVYLWTLWLTVEAVGASHQLSFKRSLLAVVLPLLAVLAFLVVVVIAAGAALTLPFFRGTPYIPRI